jgi:hypothetical protein
VAESAAIQLLCSRLRWGKLAEVGRVVAQLAGCWREFVADSERRHAGKLGRMEGACWKRIERHGAMGSKEGGRLVYAGNSKRRLKTEILVKDCFGGHYENKR